MATGNIKFHIYTLSLWYRYMCAWCRLMTCVFHYVSHRAHQSDQMDICNNYNNHCHWHYHVHCRFTKPIVASKCYNWLYKARLFHVAQDDLIYNTINDNLDVLGICCRGEVDKQPSFAMENPWLKSLFYKYTSSIHITVWTYTHQSEWHVITYIGIVGGNIVTKFTLSQVHAKYTICANSHCSCSTNCHLLFN